MIGPGSDKKHIYINIQVTAQDKTALACPSPLQNCKRKNNYFVMLPDQLDLLRLLIEAAASEFQGSVQRKGTIFFQSWPMSFLFA